MPDLVKLGVAKADDNKKKEAVASYRKQVKAANSLQKRVEARNQSKEKHNTSPANTYTKNVAKDSPLTVGTDSLDGKSGRFFLARIGEIAQTNPEEGKKLYDMYESERANPSSPLYDIYANPTSNNAKYNAQTEKAMGEWQALQQELSYWAKNDRNYSDDEIISRINWKNYPTLSKMNNTKNGGQTVYLTQPIGYNEDAMYGVLWAARNPELSTGDYSMDAVLAAAGRGKEYQRDDTKAARLDPTSKSYNPYLVGSTMDSEMQLFGLNGFDADWLGNNLQYRGTDEYASIYKAEQTTEKAEKELADLQAELETDLASGLTLDEAFSEELLDDYPTLRSMQQGLDKGSPVSITRSVAYDLPSLKSAYDKSYQQMYGTETNADYAASVAESTGAQPKKNAARDKVAGASVLNQRQYFGAIWQTGTDDEKKSIASSGNVDYAPSVEDIQSSIQQGTSGKQGAMSSKQLTVSQQTSTPFFDAMDAWNGAGKDTGFSDESKKLLEYAGISPEDVSPDDSKLALKIMTGLDTAAANGDSQAQSYLQNFDVFFENLQYQASLVADTNERKTAADEQLAAIDQQWKEAFGDDTPEYRAHKYAMETIYSFKDAPKPDWGAYDAIGWAAQQEGATDESIARTAQSALSINKQQIAYLEALMAQSEQYGVPEEYLANMQATVENLEKANRLIASYSLKNSKDYAQGVAAFDEMVFDTSPDAYNSGRGSAENVIRAISNPESIQDYDNSPNRVGGPLLMSLAQADPDVAYTELMTDAERNNFKYLYATQGEESAMAYFSDLRSQLSARYAQGESEKYQQFGEELPVAASVSSILTSPAQIQGFMYTIGQAIAGEQADPNSPWFRSNRFVSSSRQGTKNAFADAVGDSETAKNIFNFFYDALMSTGDSLVSAAVGGATGVANAGLAIMSTEAASNAMQEALYKGADSKTAAFAGLAAGAAEAITEKVPFEKITELYHAGSAGGKVLKLIADNVIGEGVGEGASEYLGALGDYLVMGDDSDFVQSVEQYKADGMAEDEAVRQAVNDLTERALYAALAGTVSGVASSGASYVAGKLTGSNADVQGNQQEQQEQQTNEQAETTPVSEGETTTQASDGTNTEMPVETSAETSTEAVQPGSDSTASDMQNVTADNAVNVLYKAQQNGVGQMQQTASVDAVLRSFGVEDATATAAAKNVIASGDLAKVTKAIENAPDKSKAAQAIAMAMLNPDSESAATLADMGDTITADDVVGLMQMYDLDMQDNAAVQAMGTAVEDSQVADETVAALGQMDSAGAKSAQSSLKKAKQAEKTFRDNLAKESANVNSADQALESARQARIHNTNPDTITAEKKALQNRSKAMEKWDAAKQQHQEAQQAVADAKAELNAVQEATVNQARTEALGKQQERQEIKKVDYAVARQNIDSNIQQVANMGSVVTLNGDEFEFGGKSLVKDVVAYYQDHFDGLVNNAELGDVLLNKKSVKNSLGHGMTPRKALAYAAVPSVIESGKIIDVQKNWKNNQFDTVVIAAPITIKSGDSAGDYYMAVIVKRTADSQNFYVHDVMLQGEEKKGHQSRFEPEGITASLPTAEEVTSGRDRYPTLDSLLQRIVDVKKQNMEGGETQQGNSSQGIGKSDIKRLASTLKEGMSSTASVKKITSQLEKVFSGPQDKMMDGLRSVAREVAAESVQKDSNYAYMKDYLKGTKFRLNDGQKSEAAYAMDKYGNYTRQLFKHGVYASDNANTTLDGLWQELSGMWPEWFAPDTAEGDMPMALLNRLDKLKADDAASWQDESLIDTAANLLMEKYSEITGQSIPAQKVERADVDDDELWFAFNPSTVKTNSATGISASKKIKSPVDSAKQLAKELNIGQDIGSRKVPRGVMGFYDAQAKYIAVRSTEAGNISTTMHEIGHALADKLGMTGTQDMVNKLDPVFAQSYLADVLPGEAFAEFTWRYMTDDTAAQDFAGDAFLYDFEKALRKNGLEKQVHKARDEMHAYVNATVNERIGSVIKDRGEKTPRSLTEIRRELTGKLVDSTASLEDINNSLRKATGSNDLAMHDDLRKKALLRNFASRSAWAAVTGDYLLDSHGDVIGESLAKRIAKTGFRGTDFDLLSRYMLAEHSLARDAAGKPVFDSSMTKEQREAFISDVQQYHPEVARAEEAIQDFRKEFMQAYMVDTGFMTQEIFDLFEKLYPHYAPTFRVKEGKSSKSGVGNKSFTIRTAKGSTENIYNPIDSLMQMVDSIVNMVSQNNTALVWDDVFHRYEGLGLYGREVTQDVKSDSVDTTALQNKIKNILEKADADADVMQQVIDTIGPTQVQWKGTGNVSGSNILTVQLPDGSKTYYEIFDPEIFKALSNYSENAGELFQWIGKVTGAMSALTTGSNPVFAVRNAARDFQKSVNYGTWATTYADGFAKWAKAFYEVWREKGTYKDYKALGGGGYTRLDASTKKSTDEYRGQLFKGYNTSNAGRTAKWLGRKLWNTATFSRVNEIVEQTSRYVEYAYGKHDLSTAEGRQEAFLAAQEVTTDFARKGYSNLASDVKKVVPFLGASIQGVYQTGREFTTKAERGRMPARVAKTIVNTALASALANLLVFKYAGDEEKEEFRWLSAGLKSDNFFIPNFAPKIFGDDPYIRIPLGQDPLIRGVHGAVSNAVWGETDGEPFLSLMAIAENILNGFNPVNGTIFDPIIGTIANKNYYDSKIVPTRLESQYPSLQYTEDTPELFVTLGRVFNASPMKIQYLAEQYTGFLGQIAIPFLSKDKNTGELGGYKAALNAAQRRLTSDPKRSNEITSSFYDGFSVLQQVGYAAKNNRPLNMLRRGLTEEEARAAVDEANELTGSKGMLGQAKKYLTDGYAQIEEIEARTDLSDHEKYVLTSEVRRDMMLNTLEAQEAIGEYYAKYIDGENPLYQMMEGAYGRSSNAYEKLPESYRADYESGETYMQRAYSVWEVTGKDSSLPHVSYSFEKKDVLYEVPEEDQEKFAETYKREYQRYVNSTSDAAWKKMTDEEKQKFLTNAHRKAQDAAKEEWFKKNNIK